MSYIKAPLVHSIATFMGCNLDMFAIKDDDLFAIEFYYDSFSKQMIWD